MAEVETQGIMPLEEYTAGSMSTAAVDIREWKKQRQWKHGRDAGPQW